jgi:hypothetical protein
MYAFLMVVVKVPDKEFLLPSEPFLLRLWLLERGVVQVQLP